MEEILSIVGGVARFVAILGGALSAVFIGWAGIQWMTASGDPQRMSQARMAIIGAVVGLVIVGVAFMIPGIISEIVIEPAGGLAIEGQKGVDCDGILRQQLVINRAASTVDRMQFVIRQIQAKRGECGVERWNPVVLDQARGVAGSGTSSSVGAMLVPRGLLDDSGSSVREKPGRDAANNIIIYWSDKDGQQPSDGSSAWLYVSAFNTWREGYGDIP